MASATLLEFFFGSVCWGLFKFFSLCILVYGSVTRGTLSDKHSLYTECVPPMSSGFLSLHTSLVPFGFFFHGVYTYTILEKTHDVCAPESGEIGVIRFCPITSFFL